MQLENINGLYGTVGTFQMFKPRLGNGARIKLHNKRDFVGRSFDVWPQSARAQRCRELAGAASAKAEHTTDSELRSEYLRLATALQAVALELEANLRLRTQVLESSQAWPRETVKKAKPTS